MAEQQPQASGAPSITDRRPVPSGVLPSGVQTWLMAALALYGLAGLFWVPVIFMQIAMRDLARAAVAENAPLPPRYFALFRYWFLCGIPGFGSVMAILWLMIAKPF